MAGVVVAQSTVKDGSMLNRQDLNSEVVRHNRLNWFARVGVHPELMYPVRVSYEGVDDFCRYRTVPTEQGLESEYVPSDALVTTQPGVALFLPIADCIAATLYDEEHGVLMVSHLGRHSLEQDGGVRSVEYLVEQYGTKPEDLQIWISAAVGEDSYKIFTLNNVGMKAALYEQLERSGIQAENITDNSADTATDPNYYSYSEYLKGNKPENGRHAMVAYMTA